MRQVLYYVYSGSLTTLVGFRVFLSHTQAMAVDADEMHFFGQEPVDEIPGKFNRVREVVLRSIGMPLQGPAAKDDEIAFFDNLFREPVLTDRPGLP